MSMKEEIVHNSLLNIDTSINELIELCDNFYLSENGKLLNSLKNLRRKYMTSIINVTDEINKR